MNTHGDEFGCKASRPKRIEVAYDDATRTYRFRAYNGGHYLDTELSVSADGFSWGFSAGPAHIVNTMGSTGKGEWREVTETTIGGNPPHRSVDMLLSAVDV